MITDEANHLRQILDASGEGLYSIDRDGRCTYANPRACQLLGYSLEELLGANVHKLIHHTHADGTPFPDDTCPIYLASRAGERHRVTDDIFWRKDLSRFAVSYSSFPIFDGDGSVIGASVAFADESDRVAANAVREQDLRRLAAKAAQEIRLAQVADQLDNRHEVRMRLSDASETIESLQERLR